jgi:hypothetical protein
MIHSTVHITIGETDDMISANREISELLAPIGLSEQGETPGVVYSGTTHYTISELCSLIREKVFPALKKSSNNSVASLHSKEI